MRISERKYFDTYSKLIGKEIPLLIQNFDFSENRGGLGYLTKSPAVYSSNIEGNSGVNYYELSYGSYVGFLKILPTCLK